MDRQMISEWFDYVPVFYWPVLCLEIVKFYLWAWADAETHGVARQMIVGVSYDGRIRVKFIEDVTEAPENWQLRLANLSASASKLTASSPFDLIEGPISEAIAAFLKRSRHQSWALGSSPRSTGTKLWPPILDPG